MRTSVSNYIIVYTPSWWVGFHSCQCSSWSWYCKPLGWNSPCAVQDREGLTHLAHLGMGLLGQNSVVVKRLFSTLILFPSIFFACPSLSAFIPLAPLPPSALIVTPIILKCLFLPCSSYLDMKRMIGNCRNTVYSIGSCILSVYFDYEYLALSS